MVQQSVGQPQAAPACIEHMHTAQVSIVPLRSWSCLPQGLHRRFDDEGDAVDSPQRVVLRGLPLATGKYKRWA